MLLDLLSILSLLIPLILGLLFYRSNGKPLNFFLWFIVFSSVFELISTTMVYNGINNHGMFKIFLIIDFLFFTWYFNNLTVYKIWMKITTLLIFVFLGLDGYNLIFLDGKLYPQVIFLIPMFMYLILQSMYALTTLLKEPELIQNSTFWIATGRLLYFLIIFSIYSYNYFKPQSFNDNLFAIAFKIINASGNIICNLMFGLSFLCKRIIN